MPCFHPIRAWYPASGKRGIIFSEKGSTGAPFNVKCGRCIGCRLEYSRQWAVRGEKELRSHSHSEFVTLTYNDAYLPAHGSLVPRDLQLFIKRLRKTVHYPIRFLACGEYGEKENRPHYHGIMFGLCLDDRKYLKTQNGFKYFTSEKLSKVWPFGFSMTANVSFETIAYVARYVVKKVNGDKAAEHYGEVTDEATGEVFYKRHPEFLRMSRKPGIGSAYFDKHKDEILTTDSVVSRSITMKPPDAFMRKFDSVVLSEVKARRAYDGLARREDGIASRLLDREVVLKAKLSKLKRSL